MPPLTIDRSAEHDVAGFFWEGDGKVCCVLVEEHEEFVFERGESRGRESVDQRCEFVGFQEEGVG